MPRPLLLPLTALLVLLVPARARADGVLAHEKYQLGNGLTVVLHEDHALPQVVVNVWYHVGTREEPRGRSGFAHLFEHLMFMGTKRVPDSQFDLIMEAGGGSNNASTDFDRTNYYSSGPAGLLPTLLWLEADRMEALGDAMTQAKLDLQREVVRNERRESYDNAPYGPSELLVWERMFPVDHPYHFHVIGSHEDLVAATVEDVKAFFETYYVPNNATLVVAGDFDARAVKPLIAGLFGTLPRGKEIPRRSAPAARLLHEERVTLTDEVQLPRVEMVWHSPAYYAPGDAEMDLLATALADGENGRLRRRLMRDEQVAVEVAAWQESMRLGGLFRLMVTVKAGVALERVEALVEEELERLRQEGPAERELERARAGIETDDVSALQSLHAVADRLNHYDALLGEPDRLAWDLERYRKATPASVRAWAREVLRPDARLVLRVVPVEPAAADLPSRDARPAPAPATTFAPPVPTVFRLGNGLEVWHVDRPGLPLVAATLLLPGGSVAAGAERAGLAAITADMLLEGAGDLDALAFADAADVLGASLSVSADLDGDLLTLSVLRRNVEPALALVGRALHEPRLEAAAFERLRALQLDRLQQVLDDPTQLAQRAQMATFLRGHPYGIPLGGTPATMAALTVEQVRAFHGRYHVPHGAKLVLAGDLRVDEARLLLEKTVGAWTGKAPERLRAGPVAPAEPDGLRLVLVDRPGSAQTILRFGYPGVAFQDDASIGLAVVNTILGGSFTSRLNANLREQHGYTYGASSWFTPLDGTGTFVASAAVETEVTGEALREFLGELARMRAGDLTEEEVHKALATVRFGTVQAHESLAGTVAAYLPYARYGLPTERLRQDVALLERLDGTVLETLARGHVARGPGVLVLVGDRQAIGPLWEGLGLPAPQVLSPADVLAGAPGAPR